MATQVEFAVLHAQGLKVSLGWKPRKRPGRQIDLDWLKVHGHILAPEGEWRFIDPALTADEAAALAEWLRGPASAAAGGTSIRFIEPCLAFEAAPADGGLIPLRVRFLGEVAPPWIWKDPHLLWEEAYWLTLPVKPYQLTEFASAVDGLIGR